MIARDASAPRGRFGLFLPAALLVGLVATGTVAGFAYSQQRTAARERAAVSAAESLTTRLAEVDAADWQAIVAHDEMSFAAVRAARSRLEAARRGLGHDNGAEETAFDAAYVTYVGALDRETELLADGRPELARAVDRALVDPEYNALHDAVEKIAAIRGGIADRAGDAADRLTSIAVALGALLLLLLFAQILIQRRFLDRERQQLEELASLDRLKDELIASVSHELRTPLTSIRGYLELVLEGEAGELTADQRDFLGIVERNSNRLLRLVSDLLDVAQIESGRLTLEVRDEELTGFLTDAVEAARPAAADRGVDLTFDRNGDAHVRIDRTRFAQVIDNLLSNALKFTDAGGRVDVRLSMSNGSAVVEVADTGMGIPVEEQKKLFQRFYRTSAAGEKAIQGTGLGLWISKQIVQAHGGAIAVESAVGRGTTFRVELPTTEGHQ